MLRLFGALAERDVQPSLTIRPTSNENGLGYEVSSDVTVKQGGKEEAIKNMLRILRLLFYPDCTRYALEPAKLLLMGGGAPTSQASPFRVEYDLNKSACHDFITLEDIPLVFSYYRQIADVVIDDVAHRGLTVYSAVEMKDGESVIRRNDHGGQRLVVDDVEELGKLILDFDCYRFVPDVNHYGSEVISRIPIDLDKPPGMSWKEYADVSNGFHGWLKDRGFNPRLRLTGGRGAQFILDIKVDRLAKNYSTPFPKPLKFDTWIRRFGQAGLVGAQASDLVTILALAYGQYRKEHLGLSAPFTVEMHDLGQRYWNILVDSSRAVREMGVVSVGSIHHKTGGVCMPVASVPEEFGLRSALGVSYLPDLELEEFYPKYKSPWIQTIGKNPILLHESGGLSPKEETFSLIDETFEKYDWIPKEYVQLGSERFMGKYCWT